MKSSARRASSLWVALSRWPVLAGICTLVVASTVAIALLIHLTHTSAAISDLTRDWCASVVQPASSDPHSLTITTTDPREMQGVLGSTTSVDMISTRTGPLTLELPALVYPIHMHTGYDYNDCPHWVVSARDASGHEVGIFDFVYDYPHQRIRWAGYGTLMPSDPRYGHVFPTMTLSTAESLLQRQRGISAVAGPAPRLIYFALAQGWGGPMQPAPGAHHAWTAGGTDPDDPIWLLTGADGASYFVGSDDHVYAVSDIPLG